MKKAALLLFVALGFCATLFAKDPAKPAKSTNQTNGQIKKQIVTQRVDLATYKVDNTKKVFGKWLYSVVCSNATQQAAYNCLQESMEECRHYYLVDDESAQVLPEIGPNGYTGRWCYEYRYYYTGPNP